MNGLFVFDATYQNLPLEQDGFFNTDNIPAHDTKADNYTTFMSVINAFSTEAQAQYPDMNYGGHYLLNNGVSIEPLPYEVLHVFNQHIVETAIHHGLCVYDSLSDTLYTPEHIKSYKKGTAHTLWQNQLATEAEKLALMEAGDTDDVPENSSDAQKLINGMVKERLKQAGIKGVKRKSSTYRVNFGAHAIEFYIEFDASDYSLYTVVEIHGKAFEYLKQNHEIYGLNPRLQFKDFYSIPNSELANGESYKEYKVRSLSKLRYEVHRAIDMFIDVYQHCQDLQGLYHYSINSHGDPKLAPKQIDTRFYKPFHLGTILVLAKLTKQPSYEDIKQQQLQEEFEFLVKQYYFDKKVHDEKMARRKEKSPDAKVYPYRKDITNGPDAFFNYELQEDITNIEAVDFDELLAMNLSYDE